MRPNDKRKKAKRNIKIIGGVIVAIALLWLIRLTVWGDFIGLFNVNNPAYVDNDADKVTTAQQHVLLMQDEILHGHLNALQKLDKVLSLVFPIYSNFLQFVQINPYK